MRTMIRLTYCLLLVAMASAVGPVANAQTAAADKQPRAELALDYTYLRSNAPPGGCGCFNLNGGSATFAWPVRPGKFALVGDVTAAHVGAISSSGYSLTLSAYTAGVRYLPRFGHSPLQPFGQVLVGVAHSGGSLVQGPTPTTSYSGQAFAASLGGGLDLHINRRFSLRLVEADYLVTTFNNGDNDHQNTLRLSAGGVFRF